MQNHPGGIPQCSQLSAPVWDMQLLLDPGRTWIASAGLDAASRAVDGGQCVGQSGPRLSGGMRAHAIRSRDWPRRLPQRQAVARPAHAQLHRRRTPDVRLGSDRGRLRPWRRLHGEHRAPVHGRARPCAIQRKWPACRIPRITA